MRPRARLPPYVGRAVPTAQRSWVLDGQPSRDDRASTPRQTPALDESKKSGRGAAESLFHVPAGICWRSIGESKAKCVRIWGHAWDTLTIRKWRPVAKSPRRLGCCEGDDRNRTGAVAHSV
jgi:hypothetical protein